MLAIYDTLLKHVCTFLVVAGTRYFKLLDLAACLVEDDLSAHSE